MIARVYVDAGVPHLDRLFDYAVPADMADRVRPGIRVKVPFSGRTLPGLVAEVADATDRESLKELARVVSDEVVAPPESLRLIRAVADHLAGTFMDVARLAVPPRYARAERAAPAPLGEPPAVVLEAGAVDLCPDGPGLRQALRSGRSPRAVWAPVPVAGPGGDWSGGIADLVADCVAGHRSALWLVPDAKDVGRAVAAVGARVDPSVVVTLSAAKGPESRYTAFLAAARGRARVVIGTRAAAYTPMAGLGLIAVWDEADSSFAEPHAPYPSLRDIVAIRAGLERVAVVFAAYSRSAELQDWVEKGWLREVGAPADSVRDTAALVRIASQDDRALERDPGARISRLPHDVFAAIRDGLASGPVLVWVPWPGHRRGFFCARCGEPVRCVCGGGFGESDGGVVACQTCGAAGWACACGGTRWRAVTIGSARTAQELAQAFPRTPVRRSDSAAPIASLDPGEPAIVIATPGCEPAVAGGYAAAVILDAPAFLSLPDLRTGERAVRHWLHVVALVRPRGEGGTVVLTGPATDRVVQAVARLDPAGFAARELADRREAGFPPARRMAVFAGDGAAIAEVARELAECGYVELLGPMDGDEVRLIARAAESRGEDFARLLAAMAARRSQAPRAGKLTWRLDPDWLGG